MQEESIIAHTDAKCRLFALTTHCWPMFQLGIDLIILLSILCQDISEHANAKCHEVTNDQVVHL